jgi:XRE family transcriptional regulator, aerobic/anaerobic benzoate catabolism transcriptional regulator
MMDDNEDRTDRVHAAASDVAFRHAVGKRIRVHRAIRDLSQEELARSAGVTRNFVSAIERGAQGLDAVRLRRVAAALHVRLEELLADPDGGSAER